MGSPGEGPAGPLKGSGSGTAHQGLLGLTGPKAWSNNLPPTQRSRS